MTAPESAISQALDLLESRHGPSLGGETCRFCETYAAARQEHAALLSDLAAAREERDAAISARDVTRGMLGLSERARSLERAERDGLREERDRISTALHAYPDSDLVSLAATTYAMAERLEEAEAALRGLVEDCTHAFHDSPRVNAARAALSAPSQAGEEPEEPFDCPIHGTLGGDGECPRC